MKKKDHFNQAASNRDEETSFTRAYRNVQKTAEEIAMKAAGEIRRVQIAEKKGGISPEKAAERIKALRRNFASSDKPKKKKVVQKFLGKYKGRKKKTKIVKLRKNRTNEYK